MAPRPPYTPPLAATLDGVADIDTLRVRVLYAEHLRSVQTYAEQMQDSWSHQAAWEIDPVNGSDSASGAPGAPLKTWAELRARQIGGAQLTSTITVLSPLPSGDPPVFDWAIGGRGEVVRVDFTPTLVQAFTLTGLSSQMIAATNQWPSVAKAAQNWNPYVLGLGNQFAQVTVDATHTSSLGAWAWLMFDVGGGTVVTSHWTDTAQLRSAPTATDEITVYEVQPCPSGYLFTPRGSGSLTVSGIDLSQQSGSIETPTTVLLQFEKCITPGIYSTGATWWNCGMGPSNVDPISLQGGPSNPTVITAGAYLPQQATGVVQYGASLIIDGFAYFDQVGLSVQKGGVFEGSEFGLFGSPADTIVCAWGGVVDLRTYCGNNSGGIPLYVAGGIAYVDAATMYIPNGAAECNTRGAVAITWAALAAAGGYMAGVNAAAWITPR